jgi:hypothetical protein
MSGVLTPIPRRCRHLVMPVLVDGCLRWIASSIALPMSHIIVAGSRNQSATMMSFESRHLPALWLQSLVLANMETAANAGTVAAITHRIAVGRNHLYRCFRDIRSKSHTPLSCRTHLEARAPIARQRSPGLCSPASASRFMAI